MSGPLFFDRVKESWTGTGTGTMTLAGAASGYQAFSVVGDGNTCYYCIADQSGTDWEVGIGTYTLSGTTLARTTVLASSNSGSLVSFPAGTKDVFLVVPASVVTSSWTDPGQCDGRLTLTSGTAVTTADVTGATTIYWTPYKGARVSLFDGTSVWTSLPFSETSLALGTLTSAKNYDVFAYNNAGTLALEMLAWTSDTARATALVLQDGVNVKSAATTRRYLGTFRTTTTTTTEDSIANRFLWNCYNRVRRPMSRVETAASWNYTTATWRQANANTANQLNFVCGLAEDAVEATVTQSAHGTTSQSFTSGIGVDSTTAPSGTWTQASTAGTLSQATLARYEGALGIGYHYLAWLELAQATGTLTWNGVATGTFANTPGISGSVFA